MQHLQTPASQVQKQMKLHQCAVISPKSTSQTRYRHSHGFVSRPQHSAFRVAKKNQQMWQRIEAESASSGSGWMDMPESQAPADMPIEIFPRLKERDSYKVLGVGKEASFEEVQEARNYLYEQYKGHAPSREAIELAFDDILQETMKKRHKFGFRPPTRGKRGEAEGDAPTLSLWQQIREKFEPSVPGPTIVNDGSIFVALGVWAAWQAASSDPTLPIGAAICFCAWKLYEKRNRLNPDGPHLGGSPIWGALGSTILGVVGGGLLSYALVQILPLPARLSGEAFGLFMIVMSLGFTCIFLR